jgi:T3SS negative regulator,GrlR
MKDGLYAVTFVSNQQDNGGGVISIRDGALNGGDTGYTYQGIINDGKTTLQVKQHNDQVISVFEITGNFDVDLNFNDTEEGFEAEGRVQGSQDLAIKIKGKYIAELV